MEESLKKHIALIFESLGIKSSFEIFSYDDIIKPSYLLSQKLKYDFAVCCNAEFEKDRLQEFIHKDIFESDNQYYWFEGERGECVQNNDISIAPSSIKINEKLKTNTRLPSWLDNFIFGTLHAEYAPDFQRFEYNLNLQHEDSLKYLGSYFPRSYAETFCIFNNLFCNEAIKAKYSLLTETSILSVGCGTGGDIVGLLTAINKYLPSIKRINVVAVDGNNNALNILSQIISQASQQFRKEIFLTTKQVVFDSISAIDVETSFDFIITSKMVNEIINKGNGSWDNSYYDFTTAYSPMLKESGIMMILDVTTKVGVSEFCPILLNRQINRFVYEHPDFISILPIPCSGKENCQVQCFSQKEFSVSHSKFSNDKSRVAYRILVKKVFSQGLQLRQENIQYQIQEDRCCGQGAIIADGFYLPNTTNKKAVAVDNTPAETAPRPSIPIKKIEAKIENASQVTDLDNKQSEQLGEAYIIDTNAFIYSPNIIDKIAEEFPIFVSAKVVDELDHRKDVTSGNDKKKVQKALKSINMAISSGRVQTATSDARLLPADFDRRSPDNLILSVVLKVKKMGYTPILVTSDNGFQVKAKTLKIKTITYTKVKSKI